MKLLVSDIVFIFLDLIVVGIYSLESAFLKIIFRFLGKRNFMYLSVLPFIPIRQFAQCCQHLKLEFESQMRRFSTIYSSRVRCYQIFERLKHSESVLPSFPSICPSFFALFCRKIFFTKYFQLIFADWQESVGAHFLSTFLSPIKCPFCGGRQFTVKRRKCQKFSPPYPFL